MVAEVAANDMLLTVPEDANDLLGNAYYQGFDGMFISADKISPRFFDLKTRLAGEIFAKVLHLSDAFGHRWRLLRLSQRKP